MQLLAQATFVVSVGAALFCLYLLLSWTKIFRHHVYNIWLILHINLEWAKNFYFLGLKVSSLQKAGKFTCFVFCISFYWWNLLENFSPMIWNANNCVLLDPMLFWRIHRLWSCSFLLNPAKQVYYKEPSNLLKGYGNHPLHWWFLCLCLPPSTLFVKSCRRHLDRWSHWDRFWGQCKNLDNLWEQPCLMDKLLPRFNQDQIISVRTLAFQ